MFKFTDTKAISESGAWLHIKDGAQPAYLTGKDGNADKSKPIRIKFMGPHSPTVQTKMRKRTARKLKETGGKVDIGKMATLEIEALLESGEATDAGNWSDATLNWENMPAMEGEGVMDFTPDNAEALFLSFPMILAQLKDEGGDINDFLGLANQR
jgi:hypothetical protein